VENSLKKDAISIQTDWNLKSIEKYLVGALRKCTIWGDLNISGDEYHLIYSRVYSALGSRSASELKTLFSWYPVVMVTDMVFFAIYDYENDFWSSWSSRYDINLSVNLHSEIGRIVRGILKRYDFEIIDNEGYTYVTPIVFQAGIPNSCFDKLFDILESTLGSRYFNAREIVNELMGYRSYMVEMAVVRYFRHHTERAVNLVFLLREMMQSLGEVFDDDRVAAYGLQPRIVSCYVRWREEQKTFNKKKRGKNQYYFPPKIVFDTLKGICLLLPEQTLIQDSIYKLKWTIIHNDDEKTKTYYSQVYQDLERNFTQETIIPIGFAEKYIVELRDSDNEEAVLISPWIIEGTGCASHILVFNYNGLLLSDSQRYISRKGTYFVFNSDCVSLTEYKNLNFMDMDLPKSWTGYKAICVYPSDRDARLSFMTDEGPAHFECRQSLDVDFLQYGTLFDEKYDDYETPVYIRFPTIAVTGNVDKHNEVMQKWQVILLHRVSGTKHTLNISEVVVNTMGEMVRISFNAIAKELFESKYGAYELWFFDGNNRKYFMFYLAPAVQYQAQVEDIKVDRKFVHNKHAGFYVRINEVMKLEFDNSSGIQVLPAPGKGSGWVEVVANSKPAYLNGYLVYGMAGQVFKIPFKKTIRKMHWVFWNEQENETTEIGKTKQFFIDELKESTWRLTVHFSGEAKEYDSVRLVLEGASLQQLQSKELELDLRGNFTVNLNMFLDTMEAHLLPQRFMIYFKHGLEDYLPVCIAIIKSYVKLEQPKYGFLRARPFVYWRKDRENELKNKSLKITSLNNHETEPLIYSLDNIKTATNKTGEEYNYILLDKPLDEGIYYVDAIEETGFSFFDNEQKGIPIYDKERVFCVNGRKVLEELIDSKSSDVVRWLSAATIALYSGNWINVIYKRLQWQIENFSMKFDVRKCSSLLFSLLVHCGDKGNIPQEVKTKGRAVCLMINNFIINNFDRTKLLKFLLESNFSNVECNSIINDLQLYLFCSDGLVTFDKTLTQRMWEINEKLAILLNLRGCVSNSSIDMIRIISKVGNDSLREIVTFSPGQSCRSNDWDECFEQVLSGKCECSYANFECTKRVWGDNNEYSQLFVMDKKGNYSRLVPDESHTDGYEIFGINYLTLICRLIPENPCEEVKENIELAKQEIYKCENLNHKYMPYYHSLQAAIQSRLGDKQSSENLFYQIGCASVLVALAGRVVHVSELQELLPFWNYAMRVYPELVYRDLILAELTLIFGEVRGE
jgi:hypothetical protein